MNFAHACFDPPFTLNPVNFVKALKGGLHINVMVEGQRISITNRFEVNQLQFDILVDQYNIFVDRLQLNILVGRMMFKLLPARKDSIQTFQIQTRLPLTTKLFNKTSNWVKRIHEVSKLG